MKRKLIVSTLMLGLLTQGFGVTNKAAYANTNNFDLSDEVIQIEEPDNQVIEQGNTDQAEVVEETENVTEEIVVEQDIDEKSYIESIHTNPREFVKMIGIVNYYDKIEFDKNDPRGLVEGYKVVVDGVDKGTSAVPLAFKNKVIVSMNVYNSKDSIRYASNFEVYAVTKNGEYLVFAQDKTVEENLAEEKRYIESIYVNPLERIDNTFTNDTRVYNSIEYYNLNEDRNLVKSYKIVANGVTYNTRSTKIGNYTQIAFPSPVKYEGTNLEVYAVTANGEYLILTSEKIEDEVLPEEKIDVEFMHNRVKQFSTSLNGSRSIYMLEFNNFSDDNNLVKQYKLVVDGVNKGTFSPNIVSLTSGNTRQIFIDRFNSKLGSYSEVVKYESDIELYAITNNGEYLVFEK